MAATKAGENLGENMAAQGGANMAMKG